MGRPRMKDYIDVAIKPKEITRIKKGYKISKMAGGKLLCLSLDGKDRKKEREIQRLKDKIKALEGKKK